MIYDIFIEPVSDDFDGSAIATFLASMPFTVRDAHASNTFLLANDHDTLEEAIADRARDDKQFPFDVLHIVVAPKRIVMSYRLPPCEPGRTFLAWLRSHYQVRVRDEDFDDVTEQVDSNLDFIFGPPP